MKHINFLLALILISSTCLHCSAQVPSWQWGKGATGSISEGYYCSTDPSGSVYATGGHLTTIYFGSDTLNGAGIYLVKYDSAGNLQWAKTTNSPASSSQPAGITTDQFGNTYLLGSYTSTVIFDGLSLSVPGTTDHYFFLAKISSSGIVNWIKNIGNLRFYGYVEGQKLITADVHGNIYLATGFTNNPSIGTLSLTNAAPDSSSDIIIAKFDSSGTVAWARSFGGKGMEFATGIDVSRTGNIYVTGNFYQDTIIFGSTTLVDTNSSYTHWNTFVARFDSTGNPLWAKQALGNGVCYNYGCIAANTSDDVYIAPIYYGVGNSFAAHALPDPPSLSQYGFIAKFNASGVLSFVKYIQGSAIINYGLALDPCQNIWLTGSMGTGLCTDTIDGHIISSSMAGSDPMFLAAWSYTDTFIEVIPVASGGDDRNSLAADVFGNIFIEGDYEVTSLIFGTDTLRYSGTEYNFIAKYNPALDCGHHSIDGTHNVNTLPNIGLYPNPTSDRLTVTISVPPDTNGSIGIFDITGRPVRSYTLTGAQTEIDISYLPPGIYFARINGIVLRKFVKE